MLIVSLAKENLNLAGHLFFQGKSVARIFFFFKFQKVDSKRLISGTSFTGQPQPKELPNISRQFIELNPDFFFLIGSVC